MNKFLQEKIVQPIIQQLKQGATPQKLALSMSTGMSIGIMPVLGPSTPLCAFLGVVFKLNHIAIQLGNYIVYAAQILLIPVFLKYGDMMFGSPPVSFSPAQIKNEFLAAPMAFIQKYGTSIFHGTVLWFLITPLIMAVSYFILLPVFKKMRFIHANK